MNTTLKHTPGPWFCEAEFVYVENLKVRIADTTIADGDEDRLSEDASDANARLIAAAPELLEALKVILDPITNTDEALYMHSREMAFAAITKAEGK